MIRFTHKGNFRNIETFFKKIGNGNYLTGLQKYGEVGVKALEEATPRDTGKTAESWSYSIDRTKNGIELSWNNSNLNNGVNVAVIIQTGHGMPSGYYVEGVDYINPALKPVFELIGKNIWKEVASNAK